MTKATIAPEILAILKTADFTPDSVRLTAKLDRLTYLAANKALESAGGIWNRKRQAHVFAQDPKTIINLESGAIDAGNINATAIETLAEKGRRVAGVPQLFITPSKLSSEMARRLDLRAGMTLLEPSVGTGRLLTAVCCVYPWWVGENTVAVEINAALVADFPRKYRKPEIVCADFLTWEDGRTFDRIIMNPPFERGADIKHIQRAIGKLAPGGRLVAICANGKRQREELTALQDVEWTDLDPGVFAEAGTNVRAAMIVVQK